MINDDVIIGYLKGHISLNIENYYMVVIYLLFSSRKSFNFVLRFNEKFSSLCLWRHQYLIMSLWRGPTSNFRMASKWFWHLSMPKNKSAEYQFVRSVNWFFCIVAPWLLISKNYFVTLKRIKTYWSTNRNEAWFTVWETRSDNHSHFRESFREDCRIYPNTLVDFVNLVEGNISKQGTKFRKAIHVENRVAKGLWPLATGHISKYW